MPELSVFDEWMDGLFIISRLDDDDSDSYKAKKYNKHCVQESDDSGTKITFYDSRPTYTTNQDRCGDMEIV